MARSAEACPAAVAYQPEELVIEAEDGAGVPATISRVLFRGSGQLVVARADDGSVLRVQMDAARPVDLGARVRVRARPGAGRPVRETAAALEWASSGGAGAEVGRAGTEVEQTGTEVSRAGAEVGGAGAEGHDPRRSTPRVP